LEKLGAKKGQKKENMSKKKSFFLGGVPLAQELGKIWKAKWERKKPGEKRVDDGDPQEKVTKGEHT